MKNPSLFRRVLLGAFLVAAVTFIVFWSRTDERRAKISSVPAALSLKGAESAAPTAHAEFAAAASTRVAAAAATSAQVRAASVRAKLWDDIRDTRGTKLPVDPAALLALRQSGSRPVGRSASFDASTLAILAELRPGDAVTLPLFNGEEVKGRVKLVQAEANNWIRVGGELTDGRKGSFALDGNDQHFEGTVLLPDESLAISIAEQPDGKLAMVEKPIGEVICTPMPLPVGAERANATNADEPTVAAITIPVYDSRPSATAVVYLDFDGETVTDPRWAGGATIVAAAPSVSETDIGTIWSSVREDFWAFNISITTSLARYNAAPVNRRTRVIVTPTDTAAPGSGGVAYINSFNRAGTIFSSTIPCWVFVGGVKPIAEAISHEVGHTLGLLHDGRTSPTEEYYAGHGSGEVGWAPIMGVGYYRNLVQWSKGEYPNASNTEDDIAIITSATNGFGFIADEAGNTIATAANLTVSGPLVTQPGIISGANDSDFYRFTAFGPTTLNLTVYLAPISPNVDVLLQLQDSSGNVLAASNPDLELKASLITSVPPGTYYLRVAGTGRGSVSAGGYSSYGCVGSYSLNGAILNTGQPPTIAGLSDMTATTGVLTPPMNFTVSDPDTDVNLLTVSAESNNPTLVPNANIVLGGSGASRSVALTPTLGQTGVAMITLTVSDGGLSTPYVFMVTVSGPPVAPTFVAMPVSKTVMVGDLVILTGPANGTPTPTYQWYKNGVPISGATNSFFTISSASLSDAGVYTVTASNIVSSITSSPATLTVNPIPPASPLLPGTLITTGPWGNYPGYAGAFAFDGNTSTFFAGNPSDSFVYVGRDFGSAKTVDRIRYFPRAGFAWRMAGGLIRGANAPDLSDAVTLHAIGAAPPEGAWQDVTLAASAASYRYVFFTTTPINEANVAELEFYGTTPVGPPVPHITTQPLSQTVTVGSPVAFSVGTDAVSPTYQWYKNGNPIGGATGASFSISSVTLADAGSFTVTVFSAGGNVTSNAAVLTVNSLPSGSPLIPGVLISTGPWNGVAAYAGQFAFDGNTSTFFAGNPSDPFVYVGRDFGIAKTIDRIRYFPRPGFAWRMAGGLIRAANAADLSDAVTLHTIGAAPPEGVWQDITLATPAIGYRYVFFTTSPINEANVAELEFYGTTSILIPPHITSQPLSQTVNEGQPVSFTVATDAPSATFKWYKNGVQIAGATSATYSIGTVLAADAGSYTVVATSFSGSATSNPAILTVNTLVGSALLPGTLICTGPWGNYAGYAGVFAFDGNTSTFFAGNPADSFVYVGRDFGAAKTIDRIRYFPRPGFAWRMTGGLIRAANLPDLSDAVTLHTIVSAPPEGVWQDITLSVPAVGYRYVFFTTSSINEANVAELEFYGYAAGGAAPQSLPQPAAQTVGLGESVTLSAGFATPGSTFQWHKDGVAIPGATRATYQIAVVREEDAGIYTVVITDPAGRITINLAIVVVDAVVQPVEHRGAEILSSPPQSW